MPSTYAHDRFGSLVRRQLPIKIQTEIIEYPQLYYMGLQGPDLFFYYDPLRKNPAMEEGSRLHAMSGKEFFENAAGRLARLEKRKDAGPERAYLYGLLCHFTLDSVCHAYIFAYQKKHGLSHSAIEGDLDRSLIAAQGRDPVLEDLTAHFKPSRRSARVIARFYPRMGLKVAAKSLDRFVRVHRLLYCPRRPKREMLYLLLRLAGRYESLRGHIMADHAEPSCRKSSAVLTRLLQKAVPLAVRLISDFPGNLDDPAFEKNFNGEMRREIRQQ